MTDFLRLAKVPGLEAERRSGADVERKNRGQEISRHSWSPAAGFPGQSTCSSNAYDHTKSGSSYDDGHCGRKADLNGDSNEAEIPLHQELVGLFDFVVSNSFISAATRTRPAFFMASVRAVPCGILPDSSSASLGRTAQSSPSAPRS